MVEQQLDEFMAGEGYWKVPSNVPEFVFYFRMENNYVNVFHVINYKRDLHITTEQYFHIKGRIKDFFSEKNIDNVHILSLIICGEAEKVKHLCTADPLCWVIDPIFDRLVIYENQANDFYGMRGRIELFLQNPSAYIEKGKSARGEEEGAETAETARSADGERKERPHFFAGSYIPYVTVGLIIINILVFIICTFTGRMLYNKGGFFAEAFLEGKQYYRAITSMFLHWDVNHLFSNMIIFYYLGEIVEKNFGHIKYAVIYIAAGIMGNLVSAGYEIYRGLHILSVGASGAVFGVMGALLVMACTYRKRMENITINKLLIMIAYSLYSGLVGENINNAAHIGGFLSGALLAFLLWFLGKKRNGGEEGTV